MKKNDFKNDFRCKAIQKLELESKKITIKSKDKKISNEIYKIIKKYDFKTIMLYIPLKLEVDINDLILKLRREKK
ncbi:5-formyltetrahydrofolate cyclo-ligase (fragment) [Sulfurovum sp. enrichment culture clone C5]|uniref:5-formyltetrahydrofolate cyclo-ligase n=1 Tax=Sulfurovum sp. enrichment culture clone C5 TaxID=497650 RepID=A0A0S4XMZ7_9BACT